jgi:ATP-dependent RNA helicase DDX18/HAS1
LEKLLQKNYFLHQSAKDGYRSYLHAYASYSLKKIFDVNALDLTKVGKAFGFAIPPRVNINVGGGKGGIGTSGKRRREEDTGETILELEDAAEGFDAQDGMDIQDTDVRNRGKQNGKRRRIETLGKKRVEKEVYKKGKERKRRASGGQWSR